MLFNLHDYNVFLHTTWVLALFNHLHIHPLKLLSTVMCVIRRASFLEALYGKLWCWTVTLYCGEILEPT